MNIVDATIRSFQSALTLVFAFVLRSFGLLVILLIGWLLASALAKAVTFLLRKVGFGRIADRIGLSRIGQQAGIKSDAVGILGKLVYWFIFLTFLVPVVNVLGSNTVSDLLGRVIGYLPNVFVAVLVLFLGMLAAIVVADLVRGASANAQISNPNLFANIARYTILSFVALLALEQLGIATSLLNILFTAIVGAAALAAGPAFGPGGQETARKYLGRRENTANTAAAQVQTQQTMNQARTLPSSLPEATRAR